MICDRFFDSSIAYFCYETSCEIGSERRKIVDTLHEIVTKNFMPNITFLLDIDPKLAKNRAEKRENNNKYDKIKFDKFVKIRQCFLNLAQENPERIKIINIADKIPKEINNEITVFLPPNPSI